jgi:cell division protein FtsQ
MARSPAARQALARRRREPDRPSHLRLWLRRQRGLAKPAMFGLLALVVAGVVGFGLYGADPAGRLRGVAGNTSDLAVAAGLEVEEIVVEGRHNTPRDLLHAAIGVQQGDPILDFSPSEARARLETIAWVESAHVERRLPGTILVRLHERTPFAIWQNQGRFAIVDRDGNIVATEALDAFGPLPLIVGAGAEKHAPGLHDLLAAHRDILARTQAMVRVGERRWNLKLHNGIDVLLPEGHEAPALNRLAEMQTRHALLDRPLVAIDMRLPDRMVLRHPPTPPATPAASPSPGPARRQTGNSRG